MNKLVKFRSCGAEIAKTANRCPRCGAQQHVAALALCGVIAGLAIVLCFAIIRDAFRLLPSARRESDAPEPAFEEISQTIENWDITLTGFEFVDKIDGGILTAFIPEVGCKYAVAHLSVKNTGKEAEWFLMSLATSSMINAQIIYDGGYEYVMSSLLGYSDDLTNKMINPLVTVSGIVAFKVPDSVAESDGSLTLRFSQNNNTLKFALR